MERRAISRSKAKDVRWLCVRWMSARSDGSVMMQTSAIFYRVCLGCVYYMCIMAICIVSVIGSSKDTTLDYYCTVLQLHARPLKSAYREGDSMSIVTLVQASNALKKRF